jgi:hypothetical protein
VRGTIVRHERVAPDRRSHAPPAVIDDGDAEDRARRSHGRVRRTRPIAAIRRRAIGKSRARDHFVLDIGFFSTIIYIQYE